MKDHWKHLLPFSPDTSGFCAVINGTDGAGIIDDPQGCVTNYLIYEEDRPLPQKVFTSQLCNMDVIFGSEKKLLKRYHDAIESQAPAFVLLGGSPVSALIGTDLKAAARMLTKQYSVPCAGVSLTGDRFYHTGTANTYLALAGILPENAPSERIPGSVNLLGCCPLDIGLGGEKEAIELAKNRFSHLISAWGSTGCTFEKMGRCGQAEKNLVLCASAIPLAEALRKRFGTPWESWFPFRPKSPAEIGSRVRNSLRCLIIGEPLISEGIRQVVCAAAKPDLVLTAGFFSSPECGYDVPLQEEMDLLRLLAEERWDLIIGDPAFRPLLPDDARFVPLVHRAVSGKLFTNEASDHPGQRFWSELFLSLIT